MQLPAVISDHMVLQAGREVAIWGWAEAGEEVAVSIAGQTQATKAGADGRWRVQLGKLKASDTAQTLTVRGSNTLTVNDVLIGEVWLASGQSNMAFPVQRARDFEQEKAGANLPQVRMFTVGKSAEPGPRSDCSGKWALCSPETVGSFSAVGYFFGRELHQQLKVPVGLVHSSVGGTDIAAWTSLEVQLPIPELKAFIEQWRAQDAAYDPVKARADYEKKLPAWKAAAAKAEAAGQAPPRKLAGPMQPRKSANFPAHLFDGRIAPLIPYTIRGAIWYQGEHNCPTLEAGLRYRQQLPLLISDWRTRWGYDFPFAWVQLPGYERGGEGRPLVREAMLQTLRVKDTGMAVTLDVGDPNDNHPKNKQAMAHRLALWALGDVYKEKVPATSGPLPAGHKVRGSEVVLRFSHAENGLAVKDGELKGFVIAGEDRQWKPAQARIDGETVVVTASEVPKPVAVRYAWAANPEGNLFNGAALPASPFRTDDWKE